MAAAALFPADLHPNSPGAWWIEWRQSRSISLAGTVKIADLGRQVWRARLSFSAREHNRVDSLNELNRLAAWFFALRGWEQPFRIRVPHDTGTRPGSGSTVTVSSAGIVGTTLPTTGWSPANGLVMRVGQFLSLSSVTDEPRLQMVTADVVASAGAANIQITPGIQIPTTNGQTVRYDKASVANPPFATMMLSNPDQVSLQLTSSALGSITVELEEWWPDRPQ